MKLTRALYVLFALPPLAPAQTLGEVHQFVANNTQPFDFLGKSVSISRQRVVCGAHGDDQSGAAYVFSTTTGLQIGRLSPDDGATMDWFGWSVDSNENLAVVGAQLDDDLGVSSGSAYLFDLTTDQQTAKLLPSDGAPTDYFGYSVATDGTVVVVGAMGDDAPNGEDFAGSAYVFDAATGTELNKLVAQDADENDILGYDLALDGEIVVVGAPGDSAQGST